MRLENKVCIVTGSSRGLGRAIARGYAAEGAIVAITYRDKRQDAEAIAEEIGADLVLQMDVRSREQIRQAFHLVHEKHGHIDVLVNNAGVNKTGDFDMLTEEDWDYVLDVDLKGVFLCCQEVLPLMPDGGRIINIGSLSGEYGGPRTPSYAAAKAGVMALTHCLARFVGKRGICVNCLSPGAIENELTAQTMSTDVRDMVHHLVLLRRFASVDEMVGPAIFLASEESSYMTGQTLSINGGTWVR